MRLQGKPRQGKKFGVNNNIIKNMGRFFERTQTPQVWFQKAILATFFSG